MASARRDSLPPLKGDRDGVFRVQVVGNSGTGKSTLAEEVAATLGVPCFHLDKFFWQPGWIEVDDDAFRARVREALRQSERGWVVDGQYERRIGNELQNTTDIIWLDTPFLLYFPRLIKRTFGRLFGYYPNCAPGCGESLVSIFFSRESIFWWAITQHIPVKQKQGARWRSEGIEVGGKMRRIGGWGSELAEWKEAVKQMMQNRHALPANLSSSL